jgi:hypothetical protein
MRKTRAALRCVEAQGSAPAAREGRTDWMTSVVTTCVARAGGRGAKGGECQGCGGSGEASDARASGRVTAPPAPACCAARAQNASAAAPRRGNATQSSERT